MYTSEPPSSNVHYLGQKPGCDHANCDLLRELKATLNEAEPARCGPPKIAPVAEILGQLIDGVGNIQIAEMAGRSQVIRGNNNIQIGAINVVVRVNLKVQQ